MFGSEAMTPYHQRAINTYALPVRQDIRLPREEGQPSIGKRLTMLTPLLEKLNELRRQRRLVAAVRNRTSREFKKMYWQVRSARGATVKVRLAEGPSMLLRDDAIGLSVFLGDFEPFERRFVTHFVRRDSVVLDIGANAGLFTVLSASRATVGLVHAVEPTTFAFTTLEANVQVNGFRSVQCHKIALSDRDEKREMQVCSGRYGPWSTFSEPSGVATTEPFEKELVTCTTLDRFVRKNVVGPIDLIKLDVEGWESRVLQGGRDLLACDEAPVLLLELNADAARSGGSSVTEIVSFLRSLGYGLWELTAEAPFLRSFDGQAVEEEGYSENVVAAKDVEMVIARLVSAAVAQQNRPKE